MNKQCGNARVIIEPPSMEGGRGRWLLRGVFCVIHDARANSSSGPSPAVLREPSEPKKICYRP